MADVYRFGVFEKKQFWVNGVECSVYYFLFLKLSYYGSGFHLWFEISCERFKLLYREKGIHHVTSLSKKRNDYF